MNADTDHSSDQDSDESPAEPPGKQPAAARPAGEDRPASQPAAARPAGEDRPALQPAAARPAGEDRPALQPADLSASTVGRGSDESVLETLTPNEIDSLERALEQFAEQAPIEDPKQLTGFLPEDCSASTTFVLFELIKLDMAAHAEAGQIPRIEKYVDALSDLISAESVPVDLVMEELQLRREAGEQPEAEEYRRRFPKLGSVFGHLIRPSPSRSPLELDVGATIDDFFVIQTLGAGAFAQVYLARQISMQRLVALKVSKGTGGESQALAKFDHPNVVRVFDQRNLQEPPVHLLYMQYLPGGTLAEVVKLARGYEVGQRNGQILLNAVDRQLLRAAQVVPDRSSVREWLATAKWPMVVAWTGVQLARALDAAHRKEIFHRDVKPANALLSAEGIPKLADFNVSFSQEASGSGEAQFGGSIGYMAPEHLRAIDPQAPETSDDVRESADLYSLAILLWELWQGERPFDCDSAESRMDVIRTQLAARDKPLLPPQRSGGASERVLEKTLREALSVEPEQRPTRGAELAGRLKLALHPEAAVIFDPDADSLRVWLWRRSPWLVAAIVIMIPHIVVGFFNFNYNRGSMEQFGPAGLDFHRVISNVFNAVVFPAGFIIMLWRMVPTVRAIKAVQSGEKSTPQDIRVTLNLSQYAAYICGGFWLVAGVYYSSLLMLKVPGFDMDDGIQIFASMLICGGIAATYPFFGLAMLGTMVYYPRFILDSMQDPDFDARRDQMISRSEYWLLAGAGSPLLGAAMLIWHPEDRENFMLALVALTAVGLLASFLAYKQIVRFWERMSEVLSTRRSTVVPAAPGEE